MEVTVKQNGVMAFAATTGSGHTIQMDSSADFGGEDSGARPMELLLAGLGGCTSIDVVHILRKLRQPIGQCEVSVSAERAEAEPKVFTQIHVHFRLSAEPGSAGLDAKKVERAVQLSAEKYCSASIMLAKTAEITHDFELVSA